MMFLFFVSRLHAGSLDTSIAMYTSIVMYKYANCLHGFCLSVIFLSSVLFH